MYPVMAVDCSEDGAADGAADWAADGADDANTAENRDPASSVKAMGKANLRIGTG